MTFFDKVKQWLGDKADAGLSSEEQQLENSNQDPLRVDSPEEELFKQNILMGDTERSEREGDQPKVEEISPHTNDDVTNKNPNSEDVNNGSLDGVLD